MSTMWTAWGTAIPHLDGYWFETFAKKGDSFLSSAVTYTSKSVDLAQFQFGCSPFLADCKTIAGDQVAWLSAVLAVHLTTFSIN
jgi:hypothetical protein